MPRRRSLKDLITDVRSRCDQATNNGSTSFITDSEIAEWLNQATAWIEDEHTKSGCFYRLSQNLFTTANAQAQYALPDDHKTTVGVDIQVGGYWQNAHRFNFEQRNDYQNVTGDWTWPVFIHYDTWGDYLQFIPTPNGAYQVRHWYVPVTSRMVLASDNGASSFFDGVNGWETLAISWAAKKCAEKDENWDFVNALSGDIAQEKERIIQQADMRNMMEAPRVRIVRGRLWSPGVPRRWWGW